MSILYYILLLIGCGFIASPITMLCIYAFYWIYVHNVQSAFTHNIVTERYWELDVEPIKSNIAEKRPLLDKEVKMKGGDQEVEMTVIE